VTISTVAFTKTRLSTSSHYLGRRHLRISQQCRTDEKKRNEPDEGHSPLVVHNHSQAHSAADAHGAVDESSQLYTFAFAQCGSSSLGVETRAPSPASRWY
jgi:hypothetical protein